jgi:hypothetical protein
MKIVKVFFYNFTIFLNNKFRVLTKAMANQSLLKLSTN